MFKNLSPAALGWSGSQSEMIELALTYGFQGMDLDILEVAGRAKVHGLPYAKRLLASAKLRPACFALPLDIAADESLFKKKLEKLPEYAQLAAEMDCKRCVVTINPASETRPYHENFEFHRQRLSAVAQVLESAGIVLGVGYRSAESLRKGQAFQFIHDLDSLTLLLSMLAASNAGLILDTWELAAGGVSLDAVRKLKVSQIAAVQVANMPAGVATADLTDAHRLLPGTEGTIDIPAFLVALAEMGYAGPITPAPGRDVLKSPRRDLAAKELGESLTKVWKAAGLNAVGKIGR